MNAAFYLLAIAGGLAVLGTLLGITPNKATQGACPYVFASAVIMGALAILAGVQAIWS